MFETLLMETASVCLYHGILKDSTVDKLMQLLKRIRDNSTYTDEVVRLYCSIYSDLLDKKTPVFYDFLTRLVFEDENTFTLACENKELDLSGPLAKQAIRDLTILEKLALIPCKQIKSAMKENCVQNVEAGVFIDELPDWNQVHEPENYTVWSQKIDSIMAWHQKNGAGLLSQHVFFIWDGEKERIIPVNNADPITLDRLYLLESQKAVAIKNTESFLSGKPANNILFYGDRGTGKSSMVKALANAYSQEGLRLVEVPKKYLEQIPKITSMLSKRGLKFILFIDDLAFENNEEKYTALKAVLEGGIEYRSPNILLYATSNRRHLVKETFADRKGFSSDNPEDEIRARDSMQEKLSLADRFGITIIFSSPIKKEYLQIVHKMAGEENIVIDKDMLEQKAMQWEMAYNGMSPRTARQFIHWIKAGG